VKNTNAIRREPCRKFSHQMLPSPHGHMLQHDVGVYELELTFDRQQVIVAWKEPNIRCTSRITIPACLGQHGRRHIDAGYLPTPRGKRNEQAPNPATEIESSRRRERRI
jgi:hypothetical protein